jgi:hypothetical protein
MQRYQAVRTSASKTRTKLTRTSAQGEWVTPGSRRQGSTVSGASAMWSGTQAAVESRNQERDQVLGEFAGILGSGPGAGGTRRRGQCL